MKYPLLLLLNIFAITLLGQNFNNSNVGNLTLKFFKIERVQLGGSTDVQLNTNFEYLNLFEKGQRFAPDEPSSFSSLEFTFLDKNLNSNLTLEQSAGIFRNHIKGDFIFDSGRHVVHFGLGNSQVGISFSNTLNYTLGKFQIGAFFQLGLGPQFSRWTLSNSNSYQVRVKNWGIKGIGFVGNTGLQIAFPKIKNRWSINGFCAYNISNSSYRKITIDPIVIRPLPDVYEDIHFTTGSKQLSFSISLGYDLMVGK